MGIPPGSLGCHRNEKVSPFAKFEIILGISNKKFLEYNPGDISLP